jgi:mRNA interferase MazF
MTARGFKPRGNYQPDKGDIIYLDFSPQSGHEQAGRRPALVLSRKMYNAKAGLAIVCPITNTDRGIVLHVGLPKSAQTTGWILTDHVKSLDWMQRKAEFVERVPAALVDDVIARLQTLWE